jgi:hypothetical protein
MHDHCHSCVPPARGGLGDAVGEVNIRRGFGRISVLGAPAAAAALWMRVCLQSWRNARLTNARDCECSALFAFCLFRLCLLFDRVDFYLLP